jgi:hypothetical protein
MTPHIIFSWSSLNTYENFHVYSSCWSSFDIRASNLELKERVAIGYAPAEIFGP